MTSSLLSLAVCSLFISNLVSIVVGSGVGFNYGLLGDNLPPPNEVVSLIKSRGISRVRLLEPNRFVLNALQGSGIEVILGTLNGDLPYLATGGLAFAIQWTHENILPHAGNLTFRYLCVGNEVIPKELGKYVLPAIQNLDAAFAAAGLKIPVTTAVAPTDVISFSYPPSQGTFSDCACPIMKPLISFLASKNTPLLVNVHPYFLYLNSDQHLFLGYVQFTTNRTIVRDGSLGYKNLFDAVVDVVYSAMERVGGHDVEIVVSESGWPSAGVAGSIEYAKIYNNNLVAHVNSGIGTPRRPGKNIETYLFALFNENLKPAGAMQNFGLYYPNKTEVYHVNLPK